MNVTDVSPESRGSPPEDAGDMAEGREPKDGTESTGNHVASMPSSTYASGSTPVSVLAVRVDAKSEGGDVVQGNDQCYPLAPGSMVEVDAVGEGAAADFIRPRMASAPNAQEPPCEDSVQEANKEMGYSLQTRQSDNHERGSISLTNGTSGVKEGPIEEGRSKEAYVKQVGDSDGHDRSAAPGADARGDPKVDPAKSFSETASGAPVDRLDSSCSGAPNADSFSEMTCTRTQPVQKETVRASPHGDEIRVDSSSAASVDIAPPSTPAYGVGDPRDGAPNAIDSETRALDSFARSGTAAPGESPVCGRDDARCTSLTSSGEHSSSSSESQQGNISPGAPCDSPQLAHMESTNNVDSPLATTKIASGSAKDAEDSAETRSKTIRGVQCSEVASVSDAGDTDVNIAGTSDPEMDESAAATPPVGAGTLEPKDVTGGVSFGTLPTRYMTLHAPGRAEQVETGTASLPTGETARKGSEGLAGAHGNPNNETPQAAVSQGSASASTAIRTMEIETVQGGIYSSTPLDQMVEGEAPHADLMVSSLGVMGLGQLTPPKHVHGLAHQEGGVGEADRTLVAGSETHQVGKSALAGTEPFSEVEPVPDGILGGSLPVVVGSGAREGGINQLECGMTLPSDLGPMGTEETKEGSARQTADMECTIRDQEEGEGVVIDVESTGEPKPANGGAETPRNVDSSRSSLPLRIGTMLGTDTSKVTAYEESTPVARSPLSGPFARYPPALGAATARANAKKVADAVAELETATEAAVAEVREVVSAVVSAIHADLKRNAALQRATAVRVAPSPAPLGSSSITTVSTSAAQSSSSTSASLAETVDGHQLPAEARSRSITMAVARDLVDKTRMRTTRSTRGNARKNDRHDDMIHAMCMICLEKLSDPTERGSAKVLGLLDSCSHRYCYPCILEWSKVTNKCPQCMSRFHTIRAVKELRRNNSNANSSRDCRYRGVAVTVEDRDQTCMDVHDVMVLDPGVRCRDGCLLRGAVDSLQRGWEFSVQCERCSVWFHGVCVGFHEERTVPDRWFCHACGGPPYPPPQRSASSASGSSSSARGRGLTRGRVRGRGQTGSTSGGRYPPPAPVPRRARGGGLLVGSGHVLAQPIDSGARTRSRISTLSSSDGTAKGTGGGAAAEGAVQTRESQAQSLNGAQASPPPSSAPQQLSPRLRLSLPSLPGLPPPPTRSRRRLHLTLTSPDPEHSSSSSVQICEGSFSQATSSSLSTPPPRSPPSRPREDTLSPATPRLSPTTPPATSIPNGSSEDIPKTGTRPFALPKPPASSVLRELGAAEMTDLCDICGFDTEPDNLIVYCESCNMGVHQNCYGISTIPNKAWYCSPCSAGIHPSTLSCRFCPVKGGALKRCTDGRWGHILCAFWIPECCFIDPRKMEPIGSISLRGQTGGVEEFLPNFRFRMCHICGTMTGCSIRCYATGCRFHLHPMCGKKAGNVYMEIETPEARADGRDQGVHLVAKCPRHHKEKGCARKSRGSRRPRPSIGCGDDPLRVFGTTIEISDPTEGNVVLRGKVTWYDPVRSRYCVVEEGTIDGGNGCAHWVAADKLEAMKAMSIHPRYGRSFVTRRPPSTEPELPEGESTATATAMATAAGNAPKGGAYIKLEPQDGEDAGEEEEDDGESVPAEEVEDKEQPKAVASDGEKGPGVVDSDETESESEVEGEGEGEEMRLMLNAGISTGDSTPETAELESTSQDGFDNRTTERLDSEPVIGQGSLGLGAGNSRDGDDALLAQMEGMVKEEKDVSPASESEEAPATKRTSSRLAIKAAMKAAQQVVPEERFDHQAQAQGEKRKFSVEDDDRLDSEREACPVREPEQDDQAQEGQVVNDPAPTERKGDRAVEGSTADPGHTCQKAADSSDPQPGDDCPRRNDGIPSDVDMRENAWNPNETSSGGLVAVTTATEADGSATHLDAGGTKPGKLPPRSGPKEDAPNPARTVKLRSEARTAQHQYEQQHLRQRDRTSRYPLRATRQRSNADQESNFEPVGVDTPPTKNARVDNRPVLDPLPDRNDSTASSSSHSGFPSSGKRSRLEVDAREVSGPVPGLTEPLVASSSSSKKPRLEEDSSLVTPDSPLELSEDVGVSSVSSSKEPQIQGNSSELSGSTPKPMEPTGTNSTSSPGNKSRVEDDSPDAPLSASEPMETGDATPASSSEKSSDASQELPCNDAPPATEALSDSEAAAASSQRDTVASGEETGASEGDGTRPEVLGTEMASIVSAPAVVNEERVVAEKSNPQESSPARRVEPGWPALELMGQVTVMQVRSINISEGRSARYFAGGFAYRGVAGPKRLGHRMSFNFEDLENVHCAGYNESAEHLSASDLRNRGRSIVGCKRARDDDEASTGVKSPRRSPSGPEDGKGVEVNRPYGMDTMPPSPPDSDAESLEDGEIETFPDGTADIMPPSPSDDDMETFKDMILGGTGRATNGGKAPEGWAEGNPTSRKNLAGRSVKPGEDSTGLNPEDLDISSEQSSKESKEEEPESGKTEKVGSTWQSKGEASAGSAPKDACSETLNGQACSGVGRAPSRMLPTHPRREGVEDREDNCLGGSSLVPTAISRADTPVQRTGNIVSVSADVVAYDPPGNKSSVSNGATSGQGSNAGKSVGRGEASPNSGSQKDPTNAVHEEMAPASVTTGNAEPVQPIRSQRDDMTLALRSIVREQIEDILLSSSQAGASSDEHLTLPRIAEDIENELFERLYRGGAGERAYKAKYKQLILSLGNVRNYRLVTSVITGTTTPADLATKDAVGLLNSLNSNLNCLAIPLAGRLKHTPQRLQQGKGAKAEGRSNLRMW